MELDLFVEDLIFPVNAHRKVQQGEQGRKEATKEVQERDLQEDVLCAGANTTR